MEGKNIILIGMPGSGKSTSGVVLAKRLARKFIDTDILIQSKYGRTLQDILDQDGCRRLREIERDVICEMQEENYVIATGGSAVYHEESMRHLQTNGVAIFLDVRIENLYRRIKDFETRGIAKEPGQTFEDVYHERKELYEKYADIKIDCNTITLEELVVKLEKLSKGAIHG